MTCAVCNGEIERRFVGATEVYGHVARRPAGDHHYARPKRDAAIHAAAAAKAIEEVYRTEPPERARRIAAQIRNLEGDHAL